MSNKHKTIKDDDTSIRVLHGFEDHAIVDSWKCDTCREVSDEFEKVFGPRPAKKKRKVASSKKKGPIAQRPEQVALNHRVAGSNPAGFTKKKKHGYIKRIWQAFFAN